MWSDLIEQIRGPRYRAIVEAISGAIESGQLAAGAQLPTYRDLAWQLKVNVGTVSRAYAELRRQGLIGGEVGRGTFVAGNLFDAPPSLSSGPSNGAFIDLSHNFPFHAPYNPMVARIVDELGGDCDIGRLMTYQVDLGQVHHREAGRVWLELQGLSDASGAIAVTAGAQHGILLAASALTRPGDRVMTERFTYFGMKSIASMLGIDLVGVEIDEEGLLPESLEQVCRASGSRILYCSPTLHNPTTSLMSEERRERVAGICKSNGIRIIEDDVYGFLLEPRIRSICSFAPEITFYVTSLSKCIGPGLRVGFLRFPEEHCDRIGLAMRATTLMAPPLMAEITARLIADGSARRIASEQVVEIKRRQRIAGQILRNQAMMRHPRSFHIWLSMTNDWSPQEFAHEAKRLGVGVAPAELFAVSPLAPCTAVRLCVSAAHDLAQLRTALARLSDILARPWRPATPFV